MGNAWGMLTKIVARILSSLYSDGSASGGMGSALGALREKHPDPADPDTDEASLAEALILLEG